MRSRGSVLSQLLIAFSVFAVLIVVAAVVGATAVAQENATARQLTGRDYRMQQTAGHVQEAFTTTLAATSSYALSGNPAFLRTVAGRQSSFDRNIGRLRALAPRSLQSDVSAQASAGAQLFATLGRITRLPPASAQARSLASGTAATAHRFYTANTHMQDTLAGEVRRLTSESKSELANALVWSAVALGVAVLLVLAASLSTLRTVTRPLQGLAATVRRLTAGDHAARAAVRGSAEVRAVAEAVNIEADEADRLRAQEAESNRLRAMARAAGLRIREHLVPLDVLDEAWRALDANLAADAVYLRLLQEDQLGAPIGHRPEYLRQGDVIRAILTDQEIAELESLLRVQSSRVVQDIQGGTDAGRMPPRILATLRREGVASQVLTPFGVDATLLGVIVLQRKERSRPWNRAEVDAVESIAADLGRGLHHAQLYQAENQLVTDLRALDRARSDFFATVSHELRAPLTSIEGYVEMLRDGEAGPVTSQQHEMLASVDHSAARLRDLIEDVFTLSKLESGADQLATAPVDLMEVIAGAVEALRPAVASGELTLAVTGPGTELVVNGDARQLDRVLLNLLSNAVKFTPPGGRIDVTAAAEDGEAVVRVADTGIGIPAGDQERLFGRFFRASNARQRSIPGTGLGLAIVATIVQMHDGDITLDSSEGRGTTVTMQLPLPGQPGTAGDGPPQAASAVSSR